MSDRDQQENGMSNSKWVARFTSPACWDVELDLGSLQYDTGEYLPVAGMVYPGGQLDRSATTADVYRGGYLVQLHYAGAGHGANAARALRRDVEPDRPHHYRHFRGRNRAEDIAHRRSLLLQWLERFRFRYCGHLITAGKWRFLRTAHPARVADAEAAQQDAATPPYRRGYDALAPQPGMDSRATFHPPVYLWYYRDHTIRSRPPGALRQPGRYVVYTLRVDDSGRMELYRARGDGNSPARISLLHSLPVVGILHAAQPGHWRHSVQHGKYAYGSARFRQRARTEHQRTDGGDIPPARQAGHPAESSG